MASMETMNSAPDSTISEMDGSSRSNPNGVPDQTVAELHRNLKAVREEYCASDYRAELLKTYTKTSWTINRIVIVGLGENLQQLAQILDLAQFFVRLRGSSSFDILAHDFRYHADLKHWIPFLYDYHINVVAFPEHLAETARKHGSMSCLPRKGCEPILPFITRNTFLYTPCLDYVAYPHLLNGPLPEAVFGSMVDCAIAELDTQSAPDPLTSVCWLKGIRHADRLDYFVTYRNALGVLPHLDLQEGAPSSLQFILHKRRDTPDGSLSFTNGFTRHCLESMTLWKSRGGLERAEVQMLDMVLSQV